MQQVPRRRSSAMPIRSRSVCAPLPTPRPRQAAPSFSSVAPAWERETPGRVQLQLRRVDINMVITTTFSRRFRLLLSGCVAGCVLGAVTAGGAQAQTVDVMVNGEPITDLDIEARI